MNVLSLTRVKGLVYLNESKHTEPNEYYTLIVFFQLIVFICMSFGDRGLREEFFPIGILFNCFDAVNQVN